MGAVMKALMYMGPKQLELREVPIPETGDDGILVRVRAATTCGTDVKTYLRGHPKMPPPALLGHEFAGDIVKVGRAVERFRPGMRVVAHNSAPCGECFYCKHAQGNLCENLVLNFGAFAEYVAVPGPIVRLNTYELPEGFPYERAALMEPLSTVVHGQGQIRIQPGESTAIIGAGPIGLMHAQMARVRGASQIIVVDLVDERLRVAADLGATRTINGAREDAGDVVRQLAGGRGVDVAIEATGTSEGWMQALEVCRRGGRVLWFGGLKSGAKVDVDAEKVHYGEVSLFGTFHSTPRDVYAAYGLIVGGIVDTAALISARLPLGEVEKALEMMSRGEVVKVAIVPDVGIAPVR